METTTKLRAKILGLALQLANPEMFGLDDDNYSLKQLAREVEALADKLISTLCEFERERY